ncbi:helix-turn-helix domain-containing protein [Streptosporangium subroseum]|uniref:AraC family transcriptional regulator n=1 Tax=Streptosporangium subroseum TaxID=106412 RepID=UPI00341D43F2
MRTTLLPSSPSCVLVQMEAQTIDDVPSYRRMRRHSLGPVAMATIESVPQRVRALLDEVPATAEEGVQLHLVHAGRLAVEQGRGAMVASAGQALFYDAARPFRFEYPDPFSVSIVQIPKRVLGFDSSRLAALASHPVGARSGIGFVLGALLSRTAQVGQNLDPVGREAVAAAIVDVVALLGDSQLGRTSPAELHQRGLAAAANEYIRSHLADPLLGPDMIARELAVSVRTLHAVFESEPDTVARTIAKLRLGAVRRSLADTSFSHLPVSAIARSRGFTSSAHFSRSFRQAFGISPTEWRRAALGGNLTDEP